MSLCKKFQLARRPSKSVRNRLLKNKILRIYAVNSLSTCICRQLFIWDNTSTGCVLNCSEIWDADQRVNDGECSCKNDKIFSKTNMTCQASGAEGTLISRGYGQFWALAFFLVLFM